MGNGCVGRSVSNLEDLRSEPWNRLSNEQKGDMGE